MKRLKVVNISNFLLCSWVRAEMEGAGEVYLQKYLQTNNFHILVTE